MAERLEGVRRDPALTGLILAGGRSRRFGADKARALIEGTPMIERVYAALAPVCKAVLVGTDEPGRTYALPGAVRYVVDRHAGIGPLAGLQAALKAADTPWLLAVACDLPNLTEEALRRLSAARMPDLDAVVAVTPDGRRQPLCACYQRRVLPVVNQQLDAGARALHMLLDRLTVRFVALPAGVLRNVNRPEDAWNVER